MNSYVQSLAVRYSEGETLTSGELHTLRSAINELKECKGLVPSPVSGEGGSCQEQLNRRQRRGEALLATRGRYLTSQRW